ncbi:MAG TPA: hypothetical protein VM491_06690 [Burkholderiaceae bacterium]|nr:hypothetical protein [Burkholderiaceae bacterium]
MRPLCVVAAAGLLASGATAAASPPAAASASSNVAQQVAAVSRQLQQPPATRIHRSVMPDGRVIISDHPVPGARSADSWSYALPPPDVAQARADAQRAHWREQAAAFERRRQEREAERKREAAARSVVVFADLHGQPVPVGAHLLPQIPPGLVPPVYTTSPGAIRGRSPSFIGSGFSRAAP